MLWHYFLLECDCDVFMSVFVLHICINQCCKTEQSLCLMKEPKPDVYPFDSSVKECASFVK